MALHQDQMRTWFVCVDGSTHSMAAVRFLNRFLKPRDSVIFFHAVPYPDLPEKYDKVARNYLDVAEKQLSVQDVKVDKRVQRSEQDVREDIFEQAKFLEMIEKVEN